MEKHEPPQVARTRDVVNGNTTGPYSPSWVPVRPGADDHEQVPSLHAGVRTWRDGRKESQK